MQPEDRLDIERLGGFAGMGGPGAHIRSTGSLPGHALSADERWHLAALFGGAPPATRRRPPRRGRRLSLPAHAAPRRRRRAQ